MQLAARRQKQNPKRGRRKQQQVKRADQAACSLFGGKHVFEQQALGGDGRGGAQQALLQCQRSGHLRGRGRRAQAERRAH